MDLVVTLIVGGVGGWLASILMKTNEQTGILANVVIGVAGSFLGIAIAGALGVRAQSTPVSLIVGILGAALLMAVLRATGLLSRRVVSR
jgi:uncharacterized membrane protein YeaQ/YmgE (transglycosylase-associated protein family)